jgi:hypothetical protein
VIIAIMAVCAMSPCVRADMMLTAARDTSVLVPASRGVDIAAHQSTAASTSPYSFVCVEASMVPCQSRVGAATPPGEAMEGRRICILEDRTSSVSLCLYALIGIGLCHSGHWIRKASLGFIPDWYHLGGPSQIGRSIAISPDSLCSLDCCFVQPQYEPDDLDLEHHRGPLEPLLRESVFTPNTHASRGPPSSDA